LAGGLLEYQNVRREQNGARFERLHFLTASSLLIKLKGRFHEMQIQVVTMTLKYLNKPVSKRYSKTFPFPE
jgi:hypothetical protein